jgi:sugar lactone lactonase YvrE
MHYSTRIFLMSKTAWGRAIPATLGALLLASQVRAAPSVIDLPGDRAFPESITATSEGMLYVGSLGAGGIYRVKPHTYKAESWIKPGAFGTRSILGVLVDEKSNTLWACSNNLSEVGVSVAGSDTKATLKGFDLKTGAGKQSAELPGEHTFCNDIAIGQDGSVYVTNTAAPQILRLPPGGRQLEVWITDPLLAVPAGAVGLDGIAFGTDGNLYVDTYTPGKVFRIDVEGGKAGTVSSINLSRVLVQADAIRPLREHEFLIVEGGGRLDRMVIDGDSARIDTLKDGLVVPTGATIAGRSIWISEGQVGYIFDPSKKGQMPKLPFRLYSIPKPAATDR